MTDSDLVRSVTLSTEALEATIEKAINHCCKLAAEGDRAKIDAAIDLAKQRVRDAWPKGQVRGRVNVKATAKAWQYETTTEIDMPSSFTDADANVFGAELQRHSEIVDKIAEDRRATNNARDGKSADAGETT
jgi:hypothetical protein